MPVLQRLLGIEVERQVLPPPFDLEEWRTKPYLARLKANCRDWAVNGFGPPEAVFLLYMVKLVIYLAGAFAVISATTPGLSCSAPLSSHLARQTAKSAATRLSGGPRR